MILLLSAAILSLLVSSVALSAERTITLAASAFPIGKALMLPS
jgi:hypothetical protein